MRVAHCFKYRKLELMKLFAQSMFDILEDCEALGLLFITFNRPILNKMTAIALDGAVC